MTSGHQYTPFHYLGEKISSELAYFRDRLFRRKGAGKIFHRSNQYSNAFGNWGLYKLTIRHANHLLKRSKFRIRDNSTRWLPLDFPVYRFLVRVPITFLVGFGLSSKKPASVGAQATIRPPHMVVKKPPTAHVTDSGEILSRMSSIF